MALLQITDALAIAEDEVQWSAIRAQGAGGQNVNKVSSAVHLRFDIVQSSLPETLKQRLLQLADQRITREGVIVIKAQAFRSQDKNRVAALGRLQDLIRTAGLVPKARRATRPSRSAQQKRLERKKLHSETKAGRAKVSDQ